MPRYCRLFLLASIAQELNRVAVAFRLRTGNSHHFKKENKSQYEFSHLPLPVFLTLLRYNRSAHRCRKVYPSL